MRKLLIALLASVALTATASAGDDTHNGLKLECITKSAMSAVERSPTVEARIGVADVPSPDQYQLTGGGCSLAGPEPGAPGGRAHNGPITKSRPTDDGRGWVCRAMDPPGIPLTYQVEATARYCRIGR